MASSDPETSIATKPTKKRKRPSAPPRAEEKAADDRFAFAAEDLVDDDDDPAPAAGSDGDEDSIAKAGPSSLPAHLLPASSKSKSAPGLIYLSRIPPGMGPSKVKHLLSNYGEVGRVYLARADGAAPAKRMKNGQVKEKHQEHRFAEGWVEFMDKKVARSVAELLNAGTIGGKKGTRWRDDVWTMKYLPRFRWDQLSEQVALERATQTSLLRFHIQHSRTEQEAYLSAVEKARVADKIDEKAEARGNAKKEKKGRTYRQREAVDVQEKKGSGGGTREQLDGVLSKLF